MTKPIHRTATSTSKDLDPLPPHPAHIAWPTEQWARDETTSETTAQADSLFALEPDQGVTYALLVIRHGKLIYERYDAGANPIYMQYSWSMAKSVVHALVGILVGQDKIDLHAPVRVPEWQAEGDPRAAITMDQLLRMSSGLAFNEDYVDGEASDVIPMLMFEGRDDAGAYAANKPAIHPPDHHWAYSSGTTNIICRILRDIVGNGPTGMNAFMEESLFRPLGMRTPTPRYDPSGTFIGSSFLFAIPQDFARFGYLYLRDGVWDGQRILPEGWVDYARTETYRDEEQAYGAHWWLRSDSSWFMASGYDGQRILIAPDKDAIVVRCGRTNVEEIEPIWDKMNRLIEEL
ncbi:MAG: serine hydrolase [Myxococcales bacterium]|nr:class C beta-lactamase-related serine hydrolase [Myxococcales bacterium]HIK84226.1 class C beta-lactamase-related serine hydrolase [Myxococcales bacterium]